MKNARSQGIILKHYENGKKKKYPKLVPGR
jgi:hypothetical protein